MALDPGRGLPADFAWPNGAGLALSIVVNVEEGAEMNVMDGDPRPEPVDELGAVPRRRVRVHGNESNYRYGIGAGARRVFRLMEERGLPVTATAAALALERFLRAFKRARRYLPLIQKASGLLLVLLGILLVTGSFVVLAAWLNRYTPEFLLERL